MPELMTLPPHSHLDPVTEILHGVPVTDPYRWLEDQNSPQTRTWIEEQTRYARAYLDFIPGRDRIYQRIREFLAVETYDSVLVFGNRYFFRKRLPDQEQPCIYMREGVDGEDQLLIDPEKLGTDAYTAVKPLRISPDSRLLLHEVKQSGERTSTFKLLDIPSRKTVPDALPRGYLRGFAFAPDSKSFYYVHESLDAPRPFYRAAYHHVLGTASEEDREVFYAGEDTKIQLYLTAGESYLGFLVCHYLDKTYSDFYLKPFAEDCSSQPIITSATYVFAPLILRDRIVALTDLGAPNFRIVEVHSIANAEPEFVDIVPSSELRIREWLVAGEHLVVSHLRGTRIEVHVYNLQGECLCDIPVREDETVRLVSGSPHSEEILLEAESFREPARIFRYDALTRTRVLWADRRVPFDPDKYDHKQVWYTSIDGTRIPMFLFYKKGLLENNRCRPVIMTSYGGYGISMTPRFSVFVAFLVEHGCVFALPNIRGGSEFGVDWHTAAKRRNRQTAYDDFLAAAEWLLKTGWTSPDKLAIFGGSNSGLLVAAALTQRPDIFRAVVCMVPLSDMLRYHLFDNSHLRKEEFGVAEDAEDFASLIRYSPYHNVHDGIAYPAVMLVSGDADRNCNPLHARKMTARLQAASTSPYPIFLDYSEFRGHSPVLPLGDRIRALTDRMAFLCDQLEISVET